MSANRPVTHGEVVWSGKPWVIPAVIIRSVTVVVFAIFFLLLEIYAGVAIDNIYILPIYAWTLIVFVVVWAFSMLDLLFLWASNNYTLRQDGLEVRKGILRLHSFVVTPSGFGDLLVYQSIGGRIFGYGDLTVNSQGERKTKLQLVRSPFTVADTIRDIMGKPIVRVEGHT